MCTTGKNFISQRIDWQTRYTFSAKEKDKNTGYHYFGARYYDSEVSVWLSVDPMSDEYPSMSPYMYTAGNPVMLVDLDGKAITDFINSKTGETQHVEDGRDQIVIVNNEDYEKISSFKEKGINKMTFGDYKKYNGIILEGKTVDLEGDLGEITRTVYAEMSGVGTSDADRQIVAESIVNRKESGLYGKTYSDILSKDQYNAVGTDAYNDPYAYLEVLKKIVHIFIRKMKVK
ncbi:MAG: RHS repeat-associated core domain-containing protein [Bacteroidales bacterium]|nr:RHS repeat-associated core domain-containing protein [Bacteroidales bacterium]